MTAAQAAHRPNTCSACASHGKPPSLVERPPSNLAANATTAGTRPLMPAWPAWPGGRLLIWTWLTTAPRPARGPAVTAHGQDASGLGRADVGRRDTRRKTILPLPTAAT